jgi:hypothetical protein
MPQTMPLLGTMGGRLNKFRGGFGGIFSATGGYTKEFFRTFEQARALCPINSCRYGIV